MPDALGSALQPLGSCWLQGRASCGHTVRPQGGGDVVRQWGLPGSQGFCCYFFMVRYLGTILKFPQSRCTEPSVPGAWASSAEAGTVCRSHFRARLLSWLLHFRQGLVCSGALELGKLQIRGRSQGLCGQRCPGGFSGKLNLAWSCSSGPGRVVGTRPLILLVWAYPSSTGTSTFCAYLTDPSNNKAGAMIVPISQMRK